MHFAKQVRSNVTCDMRERSITKFGNKPIVLAIQLIFYVDKAILKDGVHGYVAFSDSFPGTASLCFEIFSALFA